MSLFYNVDANFMVFYFKSFLLPNLSMHSEKKAWIKNKLIVYKSLPI
jgi:hypothetical protein